MPVGAAWYRFFDPSKPGCGLVDAETPEVSIGVVASRRGMGIGRRLLSALLDEASRAGVRTLSLSVELANHRAAALYQRFGFAKLDERAGAWTMRWSA